MNILFFIFPLLLFLGIAVQGLAYYIIGIILPFLYLMFHHKKLPKYFMTIGLIFIFLHLVFVETNFILYFFPNAVTVPFLHSPFLKWPGALKSNFPSTLFFGGLLFIILYHLSKKFSFSFKNIPIFFEHFQPIRFFLWGLLCASFLYMNILFYSHFTGLDFHSIFRHKLEYMTSNDAFPSGGYRVFGFYGHPLTVAGACLTYCVFSWTLLWAFITLRNQYSWDFIPAHQHRYLPIFILGSISLFNFICILLSGGRVAFVVSFISLFVIPFIFNIRKHFLVTLVLLITIVLGVCFASQKLGVISRIEDVKSSLFKPNSFDTGNNRPYFWKTYEKMFIDSPLFGQGTYWLKEGVLKEYYNKMGYEKLKEKYVAHNVYLEILGDTGLFGMASILLGFFYLFRTFKLNFYAQNSHLKPVALSLFMAFLVNCVNGLTQNVFFDSSVIYIYLGLILILMWEKSCA